VTVWESLLYFAYFTGLEVQLLQAEAAVTKLITSHVSDKGEVVPELNQV
jgi:hypothetical protein